MVYATSKTPRNQGATVKGGLADCELPLFEPPAIEALFQATRGMPRKVNRLAHYALTSAAIDKARTVTAEHVQAAREEVAP